MALKIIIVIVVLIAAVLILAATKPNSFQVQRSITINAAPEKIFPLINNLHEWPRWAPEDRKDPTMATTYSGPESGAGAVSQWDSKGQGGKGSMQIAESVPLTRIAVKVDFIRPFQAHNLNEFRLEPNGRSTTVTWSIDASQLYAMKLVGVFMSMQGVFGKHIDEGLKNLKTLSEKKP